MRALPDYVQHKSFLPTTLRKIKEKSSEIYENIFQKTSWLPENTKDNERVYCWIHELKGYPKCICGNTISKFYTFQDGYYSFCSKECGKIAHKEAVQSTLQEKYGVENVSQLKEVKEKVKNTFRDRYGAEQTFQIQKFKDKSKQTCLEKYGKEYTLQVKEIRDKGKETLLSNYGVDNAAKSPIVQEKIKQTCLEKYGVDNPAKNKESQQKKRKTWKEKYGVEEVLSAPEVRKKKIQTTIEKYGVKCVLQADSIKEKIKQTNLERYGVENIFQLQSHKDMMKNKKDEIQAKRDSTKSKNRTFNTSDSEDKLFEELKLEYPDIIRNYKAKEYPWLCDFYIPSKKLYIELQYHWTHGKEPYNPLNEEHIKIVEKWREKGTRYYQNAIDTWTKRDVKKRNKAKENNLNWIEIF